MKNHFYKIAAIVLVCAQGSLAQPATKERILSMSIEVNASVDTVWSRWTTETGRKKFFAPSSKMELKTLGFMEILFMPSAPEGQRGAENNRVISFKENEMLSFTWDAPSKYSEVRKQRTVVVIRLEKLGDKKTKVVLSQMGWGKGAEWDEVYNYFSTAWSTFVLPSLKYSLEVAPIDWSDFPNRLPKDLSAAVVSKE